MEWTSLNDLRESYLAFFESKGHLRLPSFSLVPNGDNSLLLINAGMAPLKKYFTGEMVPPSKRVTTCQKCIRTLDIDNVGKTARHGTYFEMLGNFSFGDYFKDEAIHWSWEYLTEILKIPPELLYPSVYEEDDESYNIWKDELKVPEDHIYRMGRDDNFWELGSGPCGPCSEIYFDRGEKYGCGKPTCGPGCDCDRYIEIWNNVFSQFMSDGKGHYSDLEHKNIDTGMGLERLACVMQGVDNLFEVDTIRSILDKACELAGIRYGENRKHDVSARVITDHIRSSVMLISDGVMPSNEGRGYILRRLLRHAARHGRLLGLEKPFLYQIVDTVISQNKNAYPELVKNEKIIKKIISTEEDTFNQTIDSGIDMLNGIIKEAIADNRKTISGESAFRLHDTFGFPIDLTKEISVESSLSVDEEKFNELMDEQKNRARQARASKAGWKDAARTRFADMAKTVFCGYDSDTCDAEVLSIISKNDEEITEAKAPEEFDLVLDRTVFYGEGGGQVGDTGKITSDSCVIEVVNTQKNDGVYIHNCRLESGSLTKGSTVKCAINTARRNSIRRNHSATHLLQAALREVLGDHVNQAGSYVDSEKLHFDFNHFTSVTPEELAKVEKIVNDHILAAAEISTQETDVETAKKSGARALFGEKYGKVVRVVTMGSFSKELCGGTHCTNTSQIGLFKITGESSVASGIRRIEAVTGYGVLDLISGYSKLLQESSEILKANTLDSVPQKISSLQNEIQELKKNVSSLNSKLASDSSAALIKDSREIGGLRLVTKDLGESTIESARTVCDELKAKYPEIVAVFAVKNNGKLNFVSACGKAAVEKGAHAGNLLKEVSAVTGGRGGGRPDSATSGGSDMSKVAEALAGAADVLEKMLK